jgi:drug/metabolite transporter (DMT)-like permease
MPTDQTTRASLLAVFVTILWASSWVLIRIGLDTTELDPIGFAGLRYSVAAAVLWVVILRRPGPTGMRSLDGGRMTELVVLGLVFYAITQGAQFVAIANQPAATTSLVLSFTPPLTAVVAAVVLGERLAPIQFIGMFAVAGGAALYFTGSLGATLIGMAAALICLAANTASAVLGRRVNRREGADPLMVTTASMSVGAVALLVVGALVEGFDRPSGTSIAVIVWLAVVNTAWAFVLWNKSLAHLPAASSAVINNLMLVEIAVLAWIFLGETPSVAQLIAIAVVTIGVVVGSGTIAPGRASGTQGSRRPPGAPGTLGSRRPRRTRIR